jgi:hypothetical protein
LRTTTTAEFSSTKAIAAEFVVLRQETRDEETINPTASTVVMPIIPEEALTHSSLLVAPSVIPWTPSSARGSHPSPGPDSSGQPVSASASTADANGAKDVGTVLCWCPVGPTERMFTHPPSTRAHRSGPGRAISGISKSYTVSESREWCCCSASRK